MAPYGRRRSTPYCNAIPRSVTCLEIHHTLQESLRSGFGTRDSTACLESRIPKPEHAEARAVMLLLAIEGSRSRMRGKREGPTRPIRHREPDVEDVRRH